jgi:hypothetical protein
LLFSNRRNLKQILSAALVIASAAIFTYAQTPARKQNDRAVEPAPALKVSDTPAPAETVNYAYDFSQPQFFIRHIVVEHDSTGHGRVVLEWLGEHTPVVEPLQLSAAALGRITSRWQALRFLDSDENYQSDKQFAHLGTMKLTMRSGTRSRTAQFNWTHNRDAAALANEYRRAADQATFVFEITIARENRPLDAPQLMDELETMVTRNGLSDPQQLIPLLRELKTDERIPLIARNHAERILKKIQK